MTISNRNRALSWPYPRRKHFEESLRRTAANWFKERNLSVSPRYPFILAERDMWPENIIDPLVVEHIRQECAGREQAGRNFPLHKYIHHGCSSQAMLFNLIGPLVVRNDLEPLRQVFEWQHVTWPDDVVGASFEFDDRNVFNEEAGQPTSIDLTLDDAEGKPRVFIEAKLVEPEFGACSLFTSGDCDGRNPVRNLNECYLHFIGRRYWHLLDKHDFLKDSMSSGSICPLANHYQFFRELLLALEMGGTFVLLSDERSPTFYCTGPDGERGLMPLLLRFVPQQLLPRVVTITVQQVTQAIRESGRHPWIEEFERKYGLNGGR